MKVYRSRRSSRPGNTRQLSSEKRVSENRFFGTSPETYFFQPAAALQRKCETCKEEDQKISIQRKPKTIAEEKDLKTDKPVNEDMPSAIDLIFAESAFLKKHFPGSIRRIDVKGKFRIEIGEANLKAAYKQCYGSEQDATIGGFYCRKTDTIHAVAGSGKEHTTVLGEALHEAMHKQSKTKVFLGSSYINEGITQLFTDLIIAEQKLPPYTGHKYQQQVECARNICRLAGIDAVASHFFYAKTEVVQQLNVALAAKLKRENVSSIMQILVKDLKKFCKIVSE